MPQFDTVLKDVVLASATSLPGRLAGSNVTEWSTGSIWWAWLEDSRLFHAELQSTNDSEMICRMLEAAVAVPDPDGRYAVVPEPRPVGESAVG